MNIEFKYDVGDSVFIIDRNKEQSVCNICDDGKVILKGEILDCPKCYGRKTITNKEASWFVRGEHKVEYVSFFKENKSQMTTYCFRDGDGNFLSDFYGDDFIEENLFLSYDEAVVECEKRNLK